MGIKLFNELFEEELNDSTLDIFGLWNKISISWAQNTGYTVKGIDLNLLRFLKEKDIRCKQTITEGGYRILVFEDKAEDIYNLLPELPTNSNRKLTWYSYSGTPVLTARSLVNVFIWDITPGKKVIQYSFYWDMLTEEFYKISDPGIHAK